MQITLDFWSNFEPRYPLNMAEIVKNKKLSWKNFSHLAIQIFQNQGLIFSRPSGKNSITFCNIWVIFSSEQGKVTR